MYAHKSFCALNACGNQWSGCKWYECNCLKWVYCKTQMCCIIYQVTTLILCSNKKNHAIGWSKLILSFYIITRHLLLYTLYFESFPPSLGAPHKMLNRSRTVHFQTLSLLWKWISIKFAIQWYITWTYLNNFKFKVFLGLLAPFWAQKWDL